MGAGAQFAISSESFVFPGSEPATEHTKQPRTYARRIPEHRTAVTLSATCARTGPRLGWAQMRATTRERAIALGGYNGGCSHP